MQARRAGERVDERIPPCGDSLGEGAKLDINEALPGGRTRVYEAARRGHERQEPAGSSWSPTRGLPSETARDLAPGLPEAAPRTARGIRWQTDTDGTLAANELRCRSSAKR